MRIARLTLGAYGHFSRCALDFGAGGGLHIVYGDNEAGKSTTLRALASLLFGYPHKAEDTFRHQARDIELGGRLIGRDGTILDFVRRRTGRASLVDSAGAALSEGAVDALLGGIGRELFERVFALDHRRLREHARALLAEGGALGPSLAEAGAGIVGLRTMLEGLRTAREALFLPQGQRAINQEIKRLDELHKRARQLSLSPDRYARLSRAIADERQKLAAHRARRQHAMGELSRLDRLLRNLPRVAERQAHIEARDALGDGPLLPEEAASERARIEAASEAALQLVAASEEEAAACGAAIAAIAVDEAVLAHAEDIFRLGDARGKILAEADDLPRRAASLAEREEIVGRLLRDAGSDAEEAPPLAPLPQRRRVRRLAGTGEALATRAEERRQAVSLARERLEAAEAALAAVPAPGDTGALARAVAAASRLGDIETQLARRRRALAQAEEALAMRVAGLSLTEGVEADPVAALRAQMLPSIAGVRAAAGESESRAGLHAALERDRAGLADEAALTERELAAFAAAGAPPDEDAVENARAVRDRGWALVRGLYVERGTDLAAAAAAYGGELPLPDAFAARIAAADDIVDALRRDTARSVRHADLVRRRAEIAARDAALAERLAALALASEAAREAWDALWQRGGRPALAPREAQEWLAAAAAIVAEAPSLDARRDEIAALADDIATARSGLASALAAEGVGIAAAERLDRALGTAAACLDAASSHAAEHDNRARAAADARHRLAESERLLREQEECAAAWRAEWEPAIAGIGIPPGSGPAMAGDFLEIMSKLDEQHDAIADLRHRIAAMRADRAQFDAVVAGLAAELMPGSAISDTVDASRALERRRETTLENSRRHRELAASRGAASARTAAARAQSATQQAALARLCARAGGVAPQELPALEARSAARRKLDAELAHIERALIADGAGETLDGVVAACAGADFDTASAALADMQGLVAELDQQQEALIGELKRLEHEHDQLTDHDQAASAEQDAALATASLAESVEQYAALAVEETLLRAAIELYRERNQGPVLRRATELFARLTEGAYRGLRTDIDAKGAAIVLAQDRSGASREVEALSEGTLDQLYLALRLGVVFAHNEAREPVPFIADDLLVNFDDGRAAATLRVLAAEASTTQVLLFTHHAHLVALAQRAVPDALTLHRLPAIDIPAINITAADIAAA